ncbi:MAG: AEC family transporter, partial [Pseudomonadota bacterium]
LSAGAPAFACLGAGYAAVRLLRAPQRLADLLVAFVVRVGAPVLLFRGMLSLDLGQAFHAGMLTSFYAGAAFGFAAGFALARALGRPPDEAVAIGFGGQFSNTVLLGVPIMVGAYGEAATLPMFAIIALHAPTLYLLGIGAMELARAGAAGGGLARALARAARDVARNALMIGIALGLVCNLLEAAPPDAVGSVIDAVALATLPAGLLAVGAALARYQLQREIWVALMITALSLVAHPGVAYLIGTGVFDLAAPELRAAVLTAAMPAGLNVFVFASMYRVGQGAAASAVLLSTLVSFLTISAWLAVLGGPDADGGQPAAGAAASPPVAGVAALSLEAWAGTTPAAAS